MRSARVSVNGRLAGILKELGNGKYCFIYELGYLGPPVSLTIPRTKISHEFPNFPAFFEGLLPEGVMLEALLRKYKLDKDDYFGQLLKIGQDTVGAVTIEELK